MWKYLVAYPSPHGTQMRVGGRNHLTARIVVGAMKANNWDVSKASSSFNIVPEAIEECVRYCLEQDTRQKERQGFGA